MPKRSRQDIIDWLLSEDGWKERGGPDYDNHTWPFCFNVKLHGLDLSFEHLSQLYIDSGCIPKAKATDSDWLEQCREIWDRCSRITRQHARPFEDQLYEHGVNAVHAPFTCWAKEAWPNCEFAFLGRSGGWLVLTRYESVPLNDLHYDKDYWLKDQADYLWLRRLARTLQRLKDAVRSPNCQVELAAAGIFFDIYCSQVRSVKWDSEQLKAEIKAQREFYANLFGGPRQLGLGSVGVTSQLVLPKRRLERL